MLAITRTYSLGVYVWTLITLCYSTLNLATASTA